MGLRLKTYLTSVVLALFSSWASALGLGEIELNSALNQPLNAKLHLLEVRGLTEQEIAVSLASPRAFDSVGVERTAFLNELSFRLDLDAPGGAVVYVTSTKPVREPYLNFIVETRWPSGRLLREYTLLLDLPVFSGAEAQPVSPTEVAREPETRTPEPAATRPIQAPRPEPARTETPAAVEREDYTVRANENLWNIASTVRPDNSVSVQQTMLAIQRLNPDAFINDNINLLRRGQVLRVPSKQDIQQLTARQAMSQVAEQNRNWSGGRRADDTSAAAQLDGSRHLSDAPREERPVEGRVKLSSQDGGQELVAGSGSDGEASGIADELAVAQEELDAAGRENTELKSRIRAMEERIETMERLVEVSNEEMRALELTAQQVNEAQESRQEPALTEEIAADESPVADETEKPVQPTAAPQTSLVDHLLDNLLYVALVIGALVIGAAAYLYMRNRDDGWDDEDFDEFDEEFDLAEPLLDEQSELDDDTVPIVAEAPEAEPESEVDDFSSEAETEDVVAESDIHIAYGQYEQAEEKLLNALEREPTNVAMRLKLLEVYATQDDVQSFDTQFARVLVLGDSEGTERANVLRNLIEGAEPFDESAHDTSEFQAMVAPSAESSDAPSHGQEKEIDDELELADDTLDFEFDEAVDSSEISDTESEISELDKALDLELDFDQLDLGDSKDSESTRTDGVEASVSNELGDEDLDSFDFDLDLGDLDENINSSDVALTGDDAASDEQGDVELGDAASAQSLMDGVDESDFGLDSDSPYKESAEDMATDESGANDFGDLDFDFEGLEEALGTSGNDDFSAIDDGDDAFQGQILDFDSNEITNLPDPPKAVADDVDLGDVGDLSEALEELELPKKLEESVDGPLADDSSVAVNDEAIDRELDALGEFDADIDLGNDLDLDQLDQELDALSSGFGEEGVVAMEEPMTEFDEDLGDSLSLDEELQTVSAQQQAQDQKPSTQVSDPAPDFEIPDFDPEEDDDSNLEFLSDSDETATKLDLARAYIDMGDAEGAKDILDEIAEEGNDEQKQEAHELLSRIA